MTNPPAGAAAAPEFASPEALLSAIVDSTDDAIVSKNLDGIITSWNAGAQRIFGYTPQEMIGRPITTIIPLERWGEEKEIISKLRRGERVEHFDTQRVRKDGGLVEVSLTISPVRNGEGIVVGASKIARDITKRKQAEAAIERQQNNLRLLNAIGTSLAAELDTDKLIQCVLNSGMKLSGASAGAFSYTELGQMPGKPTLYTFGISPADFESLGIRQDDALSAKRSRGEGNRISRNCHSSREKDPATGPRIESCLIIRVVSKARGVIGCLFFGHPEPNHFTKEVEDLVSTITAQAAVAIDNARLYADLETELRRRKVAEDALKESEALSAAILESGADAIAVLRPDGALVSLNPAGLALFEVSDLESAIGRQWAEFWPEKMQGEVRLAIEAALRGSTGRFQGPCRMAKRSPKWWDVIITPIRDGEREILRLTATSRDISEQRRAEEEARAMAAEAEKQSRMKDEFLATLSHELRTPLQSILGWTQILRSDTSDPEELQQGLEVIDRNAQSQTRIIEDLLDMSRILSGKVKLDVQRVSLTTVIEAAIDTVKPSAEAKDIRLHAVIDSLAKPIAGDPNRLQQIFWNLLSNAIKFTPKGGRVQVLLERVNSHLEVSVTDTGPGISPDFLPYVFERFRQADSSTTRQHGGLGLGLAIVKHLVELHGGSARVKSGGLSHGATFTVTFPLAAVHPEPDESPAEPGTSRSFGEAPKPRLNGISVLVVDDEEDARTSIAKILEKAGAEVWVAKCAADAIHELHRSVPHVLLSDIGMPHKDGYELIREVRSLPIAQAAKVPAIALTAYTRLEDRIRAISEGFQMHISKPADGLELLTMVESLARNSKP